ncbi:MAG: NAD(P)H-hydrate dehydratase [Endozoicomonas sp. (ex Botrylloides leachii)]|nr:NAD(P)H-hydrate dehydratase [Endozoicomonas sp. (ex Botrylloides leachii)]
MNQPLPSALYTAKSVRKLDKITIEHFGIDGFELMTRAGKAAFHLLRKQWLDRSSEREIQVFCGGGNNGGDGYIIAGLAKNQGFSVSVVSLKNPEALKDDAKKAWSFCYAAGVDIIPFDQHCTITDGIVVDAMLGTGLSREVLGDYRKAITQINEAGSPVLAIDIPSGLCADTGAELGIAVKAMHTITFIAIKQGLLTAMGPYCCGQLHFVDLGVPQAVYETQPPSCYRLCQNNLASLIKKRPAYAHKGLYGHVLIAGGNQGMPGAVILAAEAAMACGVGRVTVATQSEHLGALAVRRPEVMAKAVSTSSEFQAMTEGKTALVVGPGLGQDEWAEVLLKEALKAPLPIVLDADALNLIACNPMLIDGRKQPIIITPHPGEAARLLNLHAKIIQANRFDAVSALSKRFCATTVLKGAGSLICSHQNITLCSAGNPAMAVAGMGDVLSGVIGAFLAQGITENNAACLGVWLHSGAADELSLKQGEIGMLAAELIPFIRHRLNQLRL